MKKNNWKILFLVVAVVLVLLVAGAVWLVHSNSDEVQVNKPQISVSATYDGKEIENLSTIIVEPGAPIQISSPEKTEVKSMLYKWGEDGEWREFEGKKEATTYVPDENGETKFFYVSAVRTDGTCDNVDVNGYVIVIKAAGVPQVSFEAKLDSEVMKENNVYEVQGGETITVKAKSITKGIAFIAYIFDRDEMKKVDGDTATITVPEGMPGTTKKLYIEAVGDNDNTNGIDPVNTETKTPWMSYTLKYIDKTAD